MAVRLGASLLHKVVDCLAPSLSSLLVKEKEVSISIYIYLPMYLSIYVSVYVCMYVCN